LVNEVNALLERERELVRSLGIGPREAQGRALLERSISRWCGKRGDHLEVLIYGDFSPPEREWKVEPLGITVHAERFEGTLIRGACCVLKASVTVDEKSESALRDVARRLNILLGVWAVLDQGNGACGWWSWLVHGMEGRVLTSLESEELHAAVGEMLQLPDDIGQRVEAALYWVREPRALLNEYYRVDLLRVYVGYWTALECLVEAVCLRKPAEKLSRSEKQEQIDQFVSDRPGHLTAADIEECHRTIVDRGFVGKASHALGVCFADEAEWLVEQCFRTHKGWRLYDIRNAISHGTIAARDPLELIRVEARLDLLRRIVWGMFAWFLPISAPALKDERRVDRILDLRVGLPSE